MHRWGPAVHVGHVEISYPPYTSASDGGPVKTDHQCMLISMNEGEQMDIPGSCWDSHD